jgi:putative FmdB family regulatory protein
MPIYEYQCQTCKAVYELQQSFSAETTHTCEECGKGVAKRVLHAPRVVFKGSGWYVTDSRKSNSATDDSGTTPTASAPAETPAASTTTDSGDTSAAAAG